LVKKRRENRHQANSSRVRLSAKIGFKEVRKGFKLVSCQKAESNIIIFRVRLKRGNEEKIKVKKAVQMKKKKKGG